MAGGAIGVERVNKVASWELKHNKKAVQSMSDHEFAQNIANRAETKLGTGKGPDLGRKKHKYAERVTKRYQRMTGERSELVAEGDINGEAPWQPEMGLKGHVRPDLYNKETKTAFDYKFGDAKVTSKQTQRYAKQLPRKVDSPSELVEVKPNIRTIKKRKQ